MPLIQNLLLLYKIVEEALMYLGHDSNFLESKYDVQKNATFS